MADMGSKNEANRLRPEPLPRLKKMWPPMRRELIEICEEVNEDNRKEAISKNEALVQNAWEKGLPEYLLIERDKKGRLFTQIDRNYRVYLRGEDYAIGFRFVLIKRMRIIDRIFNEPVIWTSFPDCPDNWMLLAIKPLFIQIYAAIGYDMGLIDGREG